MKSLSLIIIIHCPVMCMAVMAADPDTDKDGLSDFHEIHKYMTDPHRDDSDGDTVPDGDWHERREYNYSVRTIIRVMHPVATDHINDDYQDARVLSETDHYVELEVIHYPFNTVADAISANPNWKKDYADMHELAPGITTNWDSQMQRDLLKSLVDDGIYVDQLNDKQVVEDVSSWILNHAKAYSFFNAFHVYFPDGKPKIYPGQENSVENDKGDPAWTVQQQFEHEIIGKNMYYNASRGTCTSSSVLITTVLRAVGIPTRMIICTPVVDASDPANLKLVRQGLTHNKVRQVVLEGLEQLGQSNASHTFNEVYVGNRWRRLNYNHLGQNIIDRNLFGLLTHTHAFNDLSEARLASTWGARKPDETFKYSNAYTAVHLSDQFGKHSNLSNPSVVDEDGLSTLVVSRVRWLGADDLPKKVYESSFKTDGSGHLLLHADEPKLGVDSQHYKKFYDKVSKEFLLVRKGQKSIKARAERGYWIDSNVNCREFYVRISPTEMKKMVRGVPYKLVTANRQSKVQWTIAPTAQVILPNLVDDKTGITTLTINKIYWFHSADRPEMIAKDWRPENDEGHLLVHVVEFVPDKLSGQFNEFFNGVDKRFRLKAKGQPDVRATVQQAWWVDHTKKIREFYVHIQAIERSKMAAGVPYTLEPMNSNQKYRWSVTPGMTVSISK